MNYREIDAVTDIRLLRQSLFVLALVMLVMLGFIAGHGLHLEPATVAMSGAALLLILNNLPRKPEEQSEAVHKAFCEVEWTTIFFFIGLFIVVYGVETTGLLEQVANGRLELTGGDKTVTAIAIMWVSADPTDWNPCGGPWGSAPAWAATAV